MRLLASLCALVFAAACRDGTPARAPAVQDSASALRFAPVDSLTLVAPCNAAVTPEEDQRYRQAVSTVAGAPGVLVYAAPAPGRPCYQLGVISAALRDSLAAALRQAGVPAHVVTYFHITHVPPDDIELGGDAPARDSSP